MLKKKVQIIIASVLVFSGLGLLINTVVHATYYAPQKETAVASNAALFDLATSSKLVIPKIKVDSKIEKVGLTYAGNMAAPHNLTNVGWYKYGTAPGQTGSAVIDGHVDNGLSLPAVFKHLKELQKGDDVYITNESGKTLHFIVTLAQIYPYKEVPLQLLFNRSSGRYLNLITCDGGWVPSDKTADHRVVVYTELAPN